MDIDNVFDYWFEKNAGLLNFGRRLGEAVSHSFSHPIQSFAAAANIPSNAAKDFYKGLSTASKNKDTQEWALKKFNETKNWGESSMGGKAMGVLGGAFALNSLVDTPDIVKNVMKGKEGALEGIYSGIQNASFLLPVPGAAQLAPFVVDLLGGRKAVQWLDKSIGLGPNAAKGIGNISEFSNFSAPTQYYDKANSF